MRADLAKRESAYLRRRRSRIKIKGEFAVMVEGGYSWMTHGFIRLSTIVSYWSWWLWRGLFMSKTRHKGYFGFETHEKSNVYSKQE
jgi:hypothetical protein